MTAGNNGASTPEDDDPFGYLYEDGQASGAQSPRQGGYGYPGPVSQPGVPRTSYNQVRTVGERQYGQQVPQQQPYGGQQQAQYGGPNAQYAAPETYPGGGPTAHVPVQGGRGRSGGPGSGGPNTKGLLIGAIAVVAVVLVGIGVAMITNNGKDSNKKDEAATSAGPAGQVEESPKPKQSETPSEAPHGAAEAGRGDAETRRHGHARQLGRGREERERPVHQSERGRQVRDLVGRRAAWRASTRCG